MRSVTFPRNKLDISTAIKLDVWLEENVGIPFKGEIHWDKQKFKEGNYDYALDFGANMIECFFKNADDAILFKLTWC